MPRLSLTAAALTLTLAATGAQAMGSMDIHLPTLKFPTDQQQGTLSTRGAPAPAAK